MTTAMPSCHQPFGTGVGVKSLEIDEASSSAIGSVDVDVTSDDREIEDPKDLVQLSSEPKGEAV